jgi:haloacetate dehalogenase
MPILSPGTADAASMGADNYADMIDAVKQPATVRAMIEDYRAGLHVDRRHDEESRLEGRLIE